MCIEPKLHRDYAYRVYMPGSERFASTILEQRTSVGSIAVARAHRNNGRNRAIRPYMTRALFRTGTRQPM